MFKRVVAVVAALCLLTVPVIAGSLAPQAVVQTWVQMVLLLTRHTPTYTPPVASRTFAYLTITAYEAAASKGDRLQSLAGQLNGLTAVPERVAGETYDEAVLMEAALVTIMKEEFSNTGPTGQRALAAQEAKLVAATEEGVDAAVIARSKAYGEAVARHVLDWAATDGGATIVNLGFPTDYTLSTEPGHWRPTNTINLQQAPLLPKWGENRPFAMPKGLDCKVPPPPAYSEDPESEFYKQAKEVYDTSKTLTPEQAAIARFWADDPMLSFTPPGHWISIAQQILKQENADLDRTVDVLMRVSVAEADAFIGCWETKYKYDLVRPLTYIRKVIDPKWTTLINTPPFPEYTSGHSVSSSAAALVLTAIYGDNYAFTDTTGSRDKLPQRDFPNFWAAAEQAGISRLYGGIHFRAAIDNGLAQGRCIGAYAVNLKTWK